MKRNQGKINNCLLQEESQSECSQNTCKRMRPLNSWCGNSNTSRPLEDLKPELFCTVLGFVGPTSQSLISLTMLNKRFCRTMVAIGKTMLPRAKSHFRIPLNPKSVTESSTSLFIRHARMCSKILTDLSNLRDIFNRNPQKIPATDIEDGLTTLLNLLEISPALSLPLERQILSTCGKCGGKLFKFSKQMLLSVSSYEHIDHGKSISRVKFFESTLDLSQQIMKRVVYRELKLSNQVQTPMKTFAKKQNGMKCFQTTSCVNRP